VAEEVISGYKLVKHIATGQTSQVWEVVEGTSGRHFAMKLLLPEKVDDSEARRLLFHEAEVGTKMRHDNIIRIVAFDRKGPTPNFVMEFFPAGSLKSRLVANNKAFIFEHLLNILKQAATAFAFMNALGWVHRDIKPDNMLVNASGALRVNDFALAQRIPTGFFQKLFWRKGKAQGTRSYMSPEQIRGLPLDARADIYSFGATAYELVAWRPPFRGSSEQDLLAKHIVEKPISPQQYNRDVTDEFAKLVLRMLAKKKEERPRDFHEVLMALRTMRIYKADAVPPK